MEDSHEQPAADNAGAAIGSALILLPIESHRHR
jgi:hypothetical protein